MRQRQTRNHRDSRSLCSRSVNTASTSRFPGAVITDGTRLADDIQTVIGPELSLLLDEASLAVDTAVIVSRLRYTPRGPTAP